MSKTKDLRSMDETVVNEALTRQVATIMLGGSSVADCAKRLSISPNAVRTITSSDRYKELVKSVADEELGPALAKAKAQLARLTDKAVKAIEEVLDTGGARDRLEAAKTVFKAIGIDEGDKTPQDTQLTIVMPSGIDSPGRIIEVPNESVD